MIYVLFVFTNQKQYVIFSVNVTKYDFLAQFKGLCL